jgi:hypothetical protein
MMNSSTKVQQCIKNFMRPVASLEIHDDECYIIGHNCGSAIGNGETTSARMQASIPIRHRRIYDDDEDDQPLAQAPAAKLQIGNPGTAMALA